MSEPFYRKGKRQWFCKVNGKEKYLCYDPKGDSAGRARAKAIQTERFPESDCRLGDYNKLAHFISALALRVSSHYRRPKTAREYVRIVNSFGSRWKTVKVRDLKPLHLTTWLDEHATWGPWAKTVALQFVKRIFTWAVQQGIIMRSPLNGVKGPPTTGRGRECLVTDDEHHKLLAAAGAEGRRILTALYDTGCRPKEIRSVRAHHYKPELAAWVFEEGEAKTKRRIVYLSEAMQQMTEMLIERRRDWLFLVPGLKQPFAGDQRDWAFWVWFKKLKRKAGLNRKELTPYSYRHKFCTDGLLKGLSAAQVAELAGNSPEMIHKHYGHLLGEHQHHPNRLSEFR